MAEQWLGGCEEALAVAGKAAYCCRSCHEDADLGYCELSEWEVEGGYYTVCCAVLRELEPPQWWERG